MPAVSIGFAPPVTLRGSIILTLVAAGAACGGEAAQEGHWSVRDSAGVTIIETADLARLDTLAVVPATDAVRIGLADGDAPYLFTGIAGLTRLADGRIVVADARTEEIRFFDAAGTFLTKAGGGGSGPGEFREIVLLRRFAGDSLLVVDQLGRRITILDSSGQLVRRSSLAISGTVVGAFPEGALVIHESMGMSAVAQGVADSRLRLVLMDRESEQVTAFPGAEYAMRMVNAALAAPDARESDAGPVPEWATGPDGLYYAADPARLEVRVYAETGAVERIMRVTKPLANGWDGQLKPQIRGVSVDADGRTWTLIEAADESGGDKDRWVVFDADGAARYEVSLPRVPLRPGSGPRIEFGSDYVLAASSDPDGVPVITFTPLEWNEK
ncbi:MAG: 6-bladed beta-propeller [Gemmatimonadota bacterium]